MRQQDWHNEIRDAMRREDWSLRGPNQPVKVLPFRANVSYVSGYFTLGKHLIGKTPHQMQVAMGLRPESLITGARVCRFSRLPLSHEVDYELTTAYPDGVVFNPSMSNPDYLPGDPTIHQWQLKRHVRINVRPDDTIDLRPGQPLPYDWLVKG